MIDPIESTPSCEECGAVFWGVHRPFGGHYSFCGYFNSQEYLDDQRADAEAWTEQDARDTRPPSDFEGPDALPY